MFSPPTYKKVWTELYGEAYDELIRRSLQLLQKAVKKGLIIKPEFCEFDDCPDKKTKPYQPDYKDPFAVVWFCRTHMRELKEG